MARARALLALGVRLGRTGPLAIAGLVIGGVTTFGMVALAFSLGRGGSRVATDVPSATASLLAWSAGVLVAFAVAVHALRRDRDDGIRALVRARAGSSRAYLACRVGGLCAVLAFLVAGGTLLAGLASATVAHAGTARAALHTAAASLVYALAFAATLGPVALAALGARSRAGGYLRLVAVLALPELFAGWIDDILPVAWRGLGSIPGALTALRGSLMPGAIDAPRFARAAIVLTFVVVAALLIVRRELDQVDAEAPPR